MNGCAVVNIPGLTGSSSGSLTAGSATSVANRDPSGDHTGSPAARLNDSRHGFASPLRSMGTDIRRLFFQNSNDLVELMEHAYQEGAESYLIGYYTSNANFDGKFRRIQVDLPGTRYRCRTPTIAPAAMSIGRMKVSLCSFPMTPSVSGFAATYNRCRPVGDTRNERNTTGACISGVDAPLTTSIAVSIALRSSVKN